MIILSIEFIERDRSDTEPYQSASGMTSHLHHPVRIGGVGGRGGRNGQCYFLPW